MILRLPIQVRVFNEKGELMESINSTKKSQIRLKLQALPRSGWSYGTCRVWYNKPNDFWNEFSFTSYAQLDAGLITVTEQDLIDHIKSEIYPKYLEKRRLTLAQQNAIQRARQQSTLFREGKK